MLTKGFALDVLYPLAVKEKLYSESAPQEIFGGPCSTMDMCESAFAHARLRAPRNGRMSKWRSHYELSGAPSLRLSKTPVLDLEDDDWNLPLVVPVTRMQDGIFHTPRNYEKSVSLLAADLDKPPGNSRKPASGPASERQYAAREYRKLLDARQATLASTDKLFAGLIFSCSTLFSVFTPKHIACVTATRATAGMRSVLL